MRKTKIVCTIGPACDSEEMLRAMMLAGMNVARLNFSHGTHAEHQVRIDRIKKLRTELGLPIAIMLDTKGPEYRIGTFVNGKIELHSGDTFTFTTEAVAGNAERVSVSYAGLAQDLEPGDTVLGMNLAQGGHLTHGSPVNFSGKLYNIIPYGIDESGKIDYDDMAKQAQEHKPKMIIGGFSAYSGIVDWAKMREIADSIGAYLFVDMAHVAGLIAAGVYPNPVPHAHVVTTTTHKTLAGPRGGLILAKGGSEELYKKLNSAVFPSAQGGPLMHVIAAKAVALKEAMEPEFKVYQQQVAKNAKAMVEVFLNRGYKVVSGGTENHLFLLDLVDKNLTGKEADAALGRANITVNKNSVPNDPKSPFVTSGIRIGSPAVTRRGFKEAEVKELAGWMCDVLDNINDDAVIERVKGKVLDICARFPVYA